MNEACDGKNFLTKNKSDTATEASRPSAAISPKKNNPPVARLSAWILAKAIGNNPIRIIAVNLALEKIRLGWKSARSTVNGGTKRTDISGSMENKTETTAPNTNPCAIDIQEIAKPTSTGSISLNT